MRETPHQHSFPPTVSKTAERQPKPGSSSDHSRRTGLGPSDGVPDPNARKCRSRRPFAAWLPVAIGLGLIASVFPNFSRSAIIDLSILSGLLDGLGSGQQGKAAAVVNLPPAITTPKSDETTDADAKRRESDPALSPADGITAPPAVKPDVQPSGAATAGRLEIGDKLKIAVYERVDDAEKEKWGRASGSGFQQRTELTGEYAVQDGGTIALPIIGAIPAVDLSLQSLQSELAERFERLSGRKAFVTVISLERPPIYVLGPVKNPGSYKYVPGMTVLHGIALAGGFERQSAEPWQRVESAREIEKRRGAVEIMLRAMARSAVLVAERDNTQAVLPPRMLQFASEADARRILAAEADRRVSLVAALRVQEQAFSAAMQAAREEVEMLSHRLSPLDDLIKLREKRAHAMKALLGQRTINNLVALQAQGDLSDAEQRRQDAVNQRAAAQQRAALAKQQGARFESQTRTELENGIAAAEQQIAASERELAASDSILGVLHPIPVQYAPAAANAGGSWAYEIVRQQGAEGAIGIVANGMTSLRPGDLVRVIPREASRGAVAPEPIRAEPARASTGWSAANVAPATAAPGSTGDR